MNTSHGGRLWVAIVPMLLAVATLVALAATSLVVLSGVRAYVGGEGLWSKAEKDAFFYLVRYAQSADLSDYRRYETAISVPLGDRMAREALDGSPIDYEAARRGFLQGRNHAEDIDALSAIFVHFRNARFIAKAIDIWTQGDQLVERVNADAKELQMAVDGLRDRSRIAAIVAHLQFLNDQLQPLEDEFSYTLGQASRWATRLLIVILTTLGTVMVVVVSLTYGRELDRTLTAEGALRESQEVLSLAMRGGRMGAWVRDLITNKVWWSGELEELFGLAPGGFRGTEANFLEYVHEEDRPRLLKAVETAIATGTDYATEFRFRPGSEPWRWMDGRGRAIYADDGRATRLFGVGIDITERKVAEESARQNEAHFRTMADAIPQLAWIARPDGWNYWFNSRWYEYTGTTLADVEGWQWQSVHDPVALPAVLARWKSSISSGEPFEMVFPLRGADGGFRVFLTRIMPLKDERQQVLQWFGTSTDITAQRQAEEALQMADQRKDAFIATLAHELRNPLAPIRNAVEIMRLQDGVSPEHEAALDIVDRQARHLTRLVDDLLEVSRITRGKVRLQMQRVALTEPLNDAVEAARPLMERLGHTLTVSMPADTVYLVCDPTRLTQAVLNVLNNAAKFTPRGGHIWLGAERSGNEFLIYVRDTGVGIPVEHLARIFEMFYQVTAPIERATEGLGIGLALARGLLELHGGTIQASSAGIGKGSEFIVRLPFAAVESGQPALLVPERESGCTGFRRKVLVVDDNRDAAESLSYLLQLFGHEVSIAYDGVEAIHSAEVLRPDVVLLDLGLPKLNGYEAAREIRKHSSGRDLLIVAITGWGQEEDRRRSAEAGFDLHLTKPVDAKQLQALLIKEGGGD